MILYAKSMVSFDLSFILLHTTLVNIKRQGVGVGWGDALIRRSGHLLQCHTYLGPLKEAEKKLVFSL